MHRINSGDNILNDSKISSFDILMSYSEWSKVTVQESSQLDRCCKWTQGENWESAGGDGAKLKGTEGKN